MVGIGIIGLGYGVQVHLPALRRDGRAEVQALCARSPDRVAAKAAEFGVPRHFTDWRQMIADPAIDAVVVSVPPAVQEEVALATLALGKPILAEKPMAPDAASAWRMAEAAAAAGVANMIDFNFTRIRAFSEARRQLATGAIGALRHVAVTWNVENYSNRMRLENWKATREAGGGALFNFVSHSLHYLEWLTRGTAGPVTGLNARLDKMPGDTRSGDTLVALSLAFQSGAAGTLSMSAAAFPGTGHRIEIYGEEGGLLLENTTSDYMRGFRLSIARRPSPKWVSLVDDDPEDDPSADGRMLPASRLASGFVDWILTGQPQDPSFADGARVQFLLDSARRASDTGRWQELG